MMMHLQYCMLCSKLLLIAICIALNNSIFIIVIYP